MTIWYVHCKNYIIVSAIYIARAHTIAACVAAIIIYS
jgi:hypothetical protein